MSPHPPVGTFSHPKKDGRRQFNLPSPVCSYKWEKVAKGRMRALTYSVSGSILRKPNLEWAQARSWK
jgi:hypothetical protein